MRAETGETTGVGAVIMEVTAQRRADERLRLLAEAGALFSSSLDPDEIFERVARVVVPRFAESCNIYVARGESLERAAFAHADPELEPVVASLPSTYPLGEGSTALMARVFSRGKPILVPTLTPEFVDNLESLGVRRDAFSRIGTQSMIFVPLVAQRGVGVVPPISARTGRFSEVDLELGEEIGRRAAVAIENARLLRRPRHGHRRRRRSSSCATASSSSTPTGSCGSGIRRPSGSPAFLRPTCSAGRPPVLASWPLEQVGERGQTLPVEVEGRELWLSLTASEFPRGSVYAFRDLRTSGRSTG